MAVASMAVTLLLVPGLRRSGPAARPVPAPVQGAPSTR
jgi:hypothetical protein